MKELCYTDTRAYRMTNRQTELLVPKVRRRLTANLVFFLTEPTAAVKTVKTKR